MSRGYWYTFIAVVGWLIASPALTQQAKQEQPQSQGERNAEQSNPAQFSVPVRILENPEQSETDKRSQQEAAKREIEDLAAQQGMAKGTQDIVWLSKLQLFLAFAGTLALLCSIGLNRRATYAAVQGNALTLKAIEQEQTNAQKQMRAYVYMPKDIDITFARDGTGKEIFVFQPWIKNYGHTPARVKFFIISTRPVADGKIENIVWTDKLDKEEPFVIPPGDAYPINSFDIPMDDVKRLGPTYRLFYRVYVEYFTAFDDKIPVHSANVFEVVKLGNPDQVKGGIAPSKIFDFPGHSRGSCAT